MYFCIYFIDLKCYYFFGFVRNREYITGLEIQPIIYLQEEF